MPNQPSLDKEVLSFQVPRTLKVRVAKLAKKRGEYMSETVISTLTHATKDIELTPEDYREIAAAIERARNHISARNTRTRLKDSQGGTA